MLRIGPWCQLMEHVQIPAEPVETPTFPPWERQSVPVQLQKSTRARRRRLLPRRVRQLRLLSCLPMTAKMFRIKIQRQSPLSQSERVCWLVLPCHRLDIFDAELWAIHLAPLSCLQLLSSW